MATGKFMIPLETTSTGLPLTGYSGHIYIVPAGTSVVSTYPLTEDSNTPGLYYRLAMEHGSYDIYVDSDKSGTPVSGDLKIEDYDHGVIDDTVTTDKLSAAAVTGDKIANDSVSVNQFTQAARDYISSGGSVTNNPDDIYLATNASSQISLKSTYQKRWDGDSAETGIKEVGIWQHVLNNNIVNAKDYGAIGDGVTDDKAALDTVDALGSDIVCYLANSSYAYTGTWAPTNIFYSGTIIATNGTFKYGGEKSNRFRTIGGNSDASGILGEYNLVNDDSVACIVAGGTTTQPNLLGKEFHFEEFSGDGSTTVFNISATFVVNDLTRINVKVNKYRNSDGALWQEVEDTDFTVGGYGTSGISITMATAPGSDETLEVAVYGENDDSGSDPTLISIDGYDNLVNDIACHCHSMHSMIFDGEGHNSINGGSYHRIRGKYNGITGGKNIRIGLTDSSSQMNGAVGQGHIIDGDFNTVSGLMNTVSGSKNNVAGNNHDVQHDACLVVGARAKTNSNGEQVQGGGLSAETTSGIRQLRKILVGADTSSATTTSLAIITGATNIAIPDNTSAVLTVQCVGQKDDRTQAEGWQGQFLLTKVGGTCRVNNSTGNVSLTSIYAIGSPSWTAVARGLGGNLTIRVTGAASTNIRWEAAVEILQIEY